MRLTKINDHFADCRVAHQRIYTLEAFDGTNWVPRGQIAMLRESVSHDGDNIRGVEYNGGAHAVVLRGKAGDPSFNARLNLTVDADAFVGTMVSHGAAQAVRGAALESVYHTKRKPKNEPNAPLSAWDNFTIKTAWVDNELKVTYLLGADDVSDRVRVTKVDREKGETTLEMVPEFAPPFLQNAFLIVLHSGVHSFDGTYTSEDSDEYIWVGGLAPEAEAARASVFHASLTARPAALAAFAAAAAPQGLSLHDLDNISSIQIVTDDKGVKQTVDFAQITCGGYFNKCLVNALDKRWIDGIYGHAYTLPDGVNKVLNEKKEFFKANSTLGTGQMLYDNLGTSPAYKDLLKRVKDDQMKKSWEDMGKTKEAGLPYQEASNALYIQGYRDGVALMKPYLEDNPEKWAEDYFNWLTDNDNLLTWQIQVASKQFDNVRTRMYEWYVKLQVLAPDKDYGERFTTIAYAALLGVNYSKSQWSEDLRPFLQAIIEQAIAGKVDPSIMDQIQEQAAEENQELLKTLITIQDRIVSLVDGISAGLTQYYLKKGMKVPLQRAASDPELEHLIARELDGEQYKAWNELSRKGKAGGVLTMLFYGATAGYLIYTIADSATKPLTPRQIVEQVNMGILSLAILTKGVQKMMSLGVGRFLENFSRGGEGGAFRAFAGDIATWFKEGGKIVPEGKLGKAFVAIFGESSAEFMARRIGPAMAVAGLVLSAFMLYDAIKSGIVREIVFEALNAFFALADLVFIGLELFSVAWAGPVGLAIAAIGVVVILVQFIWNLVDPPAPPPDPITDFVNGPMVEKGFAAPA